MGANKTLAGYRPNIERSRLLTGDFLPPYRNSSVIELGKRERRDDKHWLSTYRNDFTGRSQSNSNHPGITAYKNKWARHLIAK
jgi:hypothetical protein